MNVSKNEIPVVWYDFSIHSCSSAKKAKTISKETEEFNTSDNGTVSAMVSIIPKIWAKPIRTIEGKIRNHFNLHAIQIGNMYAVPITTYPKFKHDLDMLLSEHYIKVEALLKVAETGELYEVAKKQLSKITDKENIKLPSVEEIRTGYGVDINVNVNFESERTQTALKVLGNDIKDKLVEDVKASAEASVRDQQKAIMETILNPVKALIKDIQDRCNRGEDDSKVVWKTLVDKIKHITEVLPQYNINNDPEVSKMFDALKESFGNLDKETLKVSADVRKDAVVKAEKIAMDFSKMFA
jgi:hypothetical protein